ncbi:MAG: dihydrolipoamide acetyltransferase family protein, partial [Phycisphaerae bacterium]
DSGRIARIVAGEGEIVEVKQPVAYLADESVDIDAWIAAQGAGSSGTTTKPPQAAAAPEPKSASPATKAPASVSDSGRVKASPAARKAASEIGVHLSQVSAGSGPGGRILSTDVAEFGQTSGEERTIPLTKMRKAIANNLTFSKQNVPHFYAKVTINAGALFDTYRKIKQAYKCSLNDFVTLASARALRQYPQLRSRYTDSAIIEKPSVNIGIAVGTDAGLSVPVLLDSDRKNLETLASYTRDVVENARKGRLEGIGQGVFTITNLGMFGVEEFQAIINPPEAAILAVGSLRESVVVENGAIKAARVMTLTLSVDHRVVDGVVAAKFLQTLKELLENPEQLTA